MKIGTALSGLFLLATIGVIGIILMPASVCRESQADDAKSAATKAAKDRIENTGIGAAFDEELAQIGQITPQQFAARYALPDTYLKQMSQDPAKASYYDLFNSDPSKFRSDRGEVFYDFRMNPKEQELFRKNGFVVSERMSAYSFAEIYYRLFSRDLPVFISTDSVLHAWHRSFDSILMELEEQALSTNLEMILNGMSARLAEARKEYGNGVLSDGVLDADYFLAVARSLLKGVPVRSQFGQEARVTATLSACGRMVMERFVLFGRDRDMDFSQFKPRGHYSKSEPLQRYFRAMMWCGRVDLRIAGNPNESSPRELAGAIVLNDLLRRSGSFQIWADSDQALQMFIGQTDSMTFAQLDGILKEAKMQDPRQVKDLNSLSSIQEQINQGKLGQQEIRGDIYESPRGSMKIQLPRSFTVLGQRFVLDSWALSKVVYDDIKWDDKKVTRRIPSAIDVAFNTLGNRHIVPELTQRMISQGGRQFRDGLNYQHNLAAVHNVIERQKATAWEGNLYTGWLGVLRELSQPTTDTKYPEVMRTRAWAMKTLNTQLGSWTQLRHDTVLYAKQSYTGTAMCVYPAGYVEPLPTFWAKMEKMALRAAEVIERATIDDLVHRRKNGEIKFLRQFARQVSILKTIAEKELAQAELNMDETKFLKEVVQTLRQGSGQTKYGGWYPQLFYNGKEDSGTADAIVADVHTDPPDGIVPDPGCILNQSVGNVDLLLLAVEYRGQWIMYGSGVLSHYEFETPNGMRLADNEWAKELYAGHAPPRPAWTQSYLAPVEKKKKP